MALGNSLHRAASQGHKEIVQTLLAHGADVNAKIKWGKPRCGKRSLKGHTEIAESSKKGSKMNVAGCGPSRQMMVGPLAERERGGSV